MTGIEHKTADRATGKEPISGKEIIYVKPKVLLGSTEVLADPRTSNATIIPFIFQDYF